MLYKSSVLKAITHNSCKPHLFNLSCRGFRTSSPSGFCDNFYIEERLLYKKSALRERHEYITTINEYGKANNVEGMLEFYKEMKFNCPTFSDNIEVHNAILDNLGKNKKLRLLRQHASKAKSQGLFDCQTHSILKKYLKE